MSDKVLTGKNGWLFLCNDTNNVLAQITGRQALPKIFLDEWARELEKRKAHAAKFNYIYKYLIVPNKHCVYDQFLPNGLSLSSARPAVQLVSIFPDVFEYPLKLLKKDASEDMYYKTDTHWNRIGAITVLNKLLEPLTGRSIEFAITHRDHTGDLGLKMTPPVSLPSADVEYTPTSLTVYDNLCNNNGRIVITHNEDKTLPVGVAFGDSMFGNMVAELGEYFSRFYFFHASVFDPLIIENIQPDIVISENVERFVSRVNLNTYRDEIFHKYSNTNINAKSFFGAIPPVPVATGIDYALLNQYVSGVNSAATAAGLEAKKLAFLNDRKLAKFLPKKEMPALGPGWRGDGSNQITGWAFGYLHEGSINPTGITLNLNSLSSLNEVSIKICEATENYPSFNAEDLAPIYEISFKKEELGIHSDSQEVFFPLPDISLRHGACYLFIIEGNPFLGSASSCDDLPREDYFFRGYFTSCGSKKFLPIAYSGSMARKIVFPAHAPRELIEEAKAFLEKGEAHAGRDFLKAALAESSDAANMLEYAKFAISFLSGKEAFERLDELLAKYPAYLSGIGVAVEAAVIFDRLERASDLLQKEAAVLSKYQPSFLSSGQIQARIAWETEKGNLRKLHALCRIGHALWPKSQNILAAYIKFLLQNEKWQELYETSRAWLARSNLSEWELLGIALAEWKQGDEDKGQEWLQTLVWRSSITSDVARVFSKGEYYKISPKLVAILLKKALSLGSGHTDTIKTLYFLDKLEAGEGEASARYAKCIARAPENIQIGADILYSVINALGKDETRKDWDRIDFIKQLSQPVSAPTGNSLCLYATYPLLCYVAPILLHMPSNAIDLVFPAPSSEISAFLDKMELNRFKIFYGFEQCERYDYIFSDYHFCKLFKGRKKTIAFLHASDGTIDMDSHSCISAVIYPHEAAATRSLIQIKPDDGDLRSLLPEIDVAEAAYTGPYHTDCPEYRVEKKEIRQQIEETYKIKLPEDRPLVFFLTDEYCLQTHIAYCVRELSKYCTVLFKPWFDHPSYHKFDESVITITHPPMNNNLLRFGADFIFCGFYSGSAVSSVMLGLPAIIYHSRAVKPQDPDYKNYQPLSLRSWLDRVGYNDIESPIKPQVSKGGIYKELSCRELTFDLLDSARIRGAILNKDYLEKLRAELPAIQSRVFGEYLREGSARKTAELVLKFAKNGTFGEDCRAIHLKGVNSGKDYRADLARLQQTESQSSPETSN